MFATPFITLALAQYMQQNIYSPIIKVLNKIHKMQVNGIKDVTNSQATTYLYGSFSFASKLYLLQLHNYFLCCQTK